MHPSRKDSTAEMEEELCEYINIQRKQRLNVGRREMLNKLTELNPDALRGLTKGDNSEGVDKNDHRVNKWYSGFHKKRLAYARAASSEKTVFSRLRKSPTRMGKLCPPRLRKIPTRVNTEVETHLGLQ